MDALHHGRHLKKDKLPEAAMSRASPEKCFPSHCNGLKGLQGAAGCSGLGGQAIAGRINPWPQAAYLLWTGKTLFYKHTQQGSTGFGFEDVWVCSDTSAHSAVPLLPNSLDEFANQL